MKHSFLDKESEIESPIRALNPKTKVISLLTIVVIVVSTSHTAKTTFLLYTAMALFLILMSNIPITVFLKRLLIIAPFVLIAIVAVPFMGENPKDVSYSLGLFDITVSERGLQVVFNVAVKSSLSVLFLTLLISSTPFRHLIRGLKELRIPSLITDSLLFMYQYIFILIDEGEKITRARDARCYGGRWIWHAHIIGYIIGALFIRSFERGERIYLAMKARGYDSEVSSSHTGRLKANDFVFISLVIPIVLIIRTIGTNL